MSWFSRLLGREKQKPSAQASRARQLGPGGGGGDNDLLSLISRMDSSDPRFDGWGNVLSGLLSSLDKRTGGYVSYCPVEDMEARQYWLADDIAKRVIETVPRLAMRRAFELKIHGDDGKETSEAIIARAEELQFAQKYTKAMMMRRAFGGAALFPVLDGAQGDLRQPLDKTKVRKVLAMHLLEPRELLPTSWYTDLRDPKFGTPERFMFVPVLTGGTPPPQTLAEIHESRLIIFQGVKVSRLYQAGDRIGWGDSVLTPIRDVLRDFGLAWGSASALLQDFAQAVLKIEGLANLMVTDQDKVARARIEQIDLLRSVLRMIVIDKNDEFSREETPINGLAQLLDRISLRMAAAADMPVTWLMGQSPAGMNATGESDREIMYERARAEQHDVEPQVEQGLELLMLETDGVCEGQVPELWGIEWPPLASPDDKTVADTRFAHAQADDLYVNNGTLTQDEVRSRWKGDKYGDIQLDEEAWQAQQQAQLAAVDAAAKQAMGHGGDGTGADGKPAEDGTATGGGQERPIDAPAADGTTKTPAAAAAAAATSGPVMVKPHVRGLPTKPAIAARGAAR